MQNKKIALLFLDAEFVDINKELEAFEIGWILQIDGEIKSNSSFYVEHKGQPSDWVVKNTRYKKIFNDKTIYKYSPRDIYLILLKQLQQYQDEYTIYVVGAAVQGDLDYIQSLGNEFNSKLPVHWRTIDLSQVFLGYLWAKEEPLQEPLAVIKMLRYFDIKSDGPRHTVDTDNEDLRKLYNVMFPKS